MSKEDTIFVYFLPNGTFSHDLDTLVSNIEECAVINFNKDNCKYTNVAINVQQFKVGAYVALNTKLTKKDIDLLCKKYNL